MSWRPTHAMVLAAGLGTRMKPWTDALPKPLVPLAGVPLIDHVLDRIAASGIGDAVINVHHHAERLVAHLQQRTRPRITISDERDGLLDTGGGIVRALPLLGLKPFLVHNSDSLWIESVGSNLDRLFRAWDPVRMDSLLLLALGSLSLGYEAQGDFLMAPDGRLERRKERQLAPFVFTGVSLAHPRLFEGAPAERFSLNLLWDRAIERQRLHGVRLDGLWMHVGTPAALKEAERTLAREEVF